VLVACLALLAVYGVLSLLNDPHGTLGTDTGGKLASLRMMDRNGGFNPDLGYWAERFDPDGNLHPLFYTKHIGDRWVNLTTLPMAYTAYPLYKLGGERAALLLPMFGAVLSALGARALARRLSGERAGWWAFWLVGLASPLLVYALDFWEHTLGVAALLWAVVLVTDVVRGCAGWRGSLLAGVFMGIALTMRTETLIYDALLAVGACWILTRQSAPVKRLVGLAVVGATGLGAVLVANQVLEQVTLGGALRAGRAASTAAAGGANVGRRIDEAVTTLVGLNRFETPLDWFVGGFLACTVAYGVWRLAQRDAASRKLGAVACAATAVVYAVRFSAGLGFVPGLLTASPLVLAGVVLAPGDKRTRRFVWLALTALPIVWIFQYSGGAAPQWGSRYLLISGALLTVVAAVRLADVQLSQAVPVVVLAVAVTCAGVAWLGQRSHAVADGVRRIEHIRADVLISQEAHLLREGGATYEPDRQWLTAVGAQELQDAFRVARAADARTIALVADSARARPHTPAGFHRAEGEERIQFLPSVSLRVTTYVRDRG
jgi:hypothetical protein